ncbi:MAG TPA: DUF4153 domain-containing protein [Opitutaceae bacterium]|nr:DUF4153 domain-containing protein [Opitutaceae bacterium]
MKLAFPTVQTVLRETGRVTARFPYVVLSAVAGTAAAIVGIEYDGISVANVVMAAALGLPLMLILRLVRECAASRRLGMALEVIGMALLVAYSFSFPSDYKGVPYIHWIRFMVIDIGLHFAVAYSPCLAGAGEWGYWQFNRRLFQRFALAFLYSAVLYIGLTLALGSMDKLLGIRVDPKRYAELWAVMAGIFNTLFFLGGVPRSREELESDTSYPRGLRAFAQFALAPLVIVFFVILYLFAFKIAKAWTWPHGWVGKPIYFFSEVGILAALLLQPARQIDAERWARWYWKYFFRALGPLAVLLLLSMMERISPYGFTEARYYGLVLGVWLLAVSILFTVRPGGSTRAIPASLALICLLSAAGPWGAFSVSSASQERKLVEMLAPLGALENGTMVPANRRLTSKEEASVTQLLTHMVSTYGRERFPVLFARYETQVKVKVKEVNGNLSLVNVNSIISFLEGNKGPTDRGIGLGVHHVIVELDNAHGIPTEGYRFLYHASFQQGRDRQHLGDLTVEFHFGQDAPRILLSGRALEETAITALVKSIIKAGIQSRHRLPASEMSVKLSSGTREWLLIVNRLEGTPQDSGATNLSSIDMDLLEK